MRKVLVNAAVSLVAICIFLAGAEVLLRSYPSLIGIEVLERFHENLRKPIAADRGYVLAENRRKITSAERGDGGPPFWINHPDRLYRDLADPVDVASGAVLEHKSDGAGFCNPALQSGRTAVDVVMIGDSFTDCTLVAAEDTFSARLELQTGLTTYNLGVRGIGPYEQLVLLRKFGLTLAPRVVVFNIYEGNDLRDILRYHDFLLDNTSRQPRKRLGGPFAVSYALAYLKSSIELTVKRLKKGGINFRYTVEADGSRVPVNVANSDIDEVRNARRLNKGEVSPDLFEPPLTDFVALAAEHGFVPVVTLLPSAHTGYLNSVEFADAAIAGEVAASSQALRTWMSENSQRIGYHFIDVVPAFHEQVASGPLAFYPANIHFTRRGHEIAAAALGAELQKILAAQ